MTKSEYRQSTRGDAGRSARQRPNRPELQLRSTTLWQYPTRTYGNGKQGDDRFRGASPAWVIWDVVERFAPQGGLVVDPFCGSGTTLDVCADLGRRALGFDVHPVREEIKRADARSLPIRSGTVDLVFMDPPYADNLVYSDDPRCLGKLPASDQRFDRAMDLCLAEAHRVLRPGGVIAIYICDVYHHRSGFYPIGFRVFSLARERFCPLDIAAVVRHLDRGNYHRAAVGQRFMLRGFNYLFLLQKPKESAQ